MSKEYDKYLNEHKECVSSAFHWLRTHGIVMLNNYCMWKAIFDHDDSKFDEDEYDAYDKYFYGEKTPEVKEAFDFAWLHHIHNNPHHWQYWVLINDEYDGTKALMMPYNRVVEMICDWWSFSWKTGNLYEIFDWYESHKEQMILHKKTRELVEEILAGIRTELDKETPHA